MSPIQKELVWLLVVIAIIVLGFWTLVSLDVSGDKRLKSVQVDAGHEVRAVFIGTKIRFVHYENSNLCFAYLDTTFTYVPCERIPERDVHSRMLYVNGAGWVGKIPADMMFDSNGHLVAERK